MIKLTVRLDTSTYKKLCEFSILNGISKSEIIRVLLNKATLKINTKKIGTIIQNAKQKGKINTNMVLLLIDEEIQKKIREISFGNGASFSEIVRCLISNADFNKLKFRTKSEVMTNAKLKILKEKKK